MSTGTKSIIALVLAAIIAAAIYGGYQYPQALVQLGAASPAGTNFSTAKVAEQTVQVSTSTVFSQLNGDANDRIIIDANAFLQNGTATSSIYTVQCATSSSASTLAGNTNYVLGQQLNSSFGTSTGVAGMYLATTSPGITGTTTATIPAYLPSANPFVRVWPAGSYLNCSLTVSGSFNALNTLDAATTGYFGFRYYAQ